MVKWLIILVPDEILVNKDSEMFIQLSEAREWDSNEVTQLTLIVLQIQPLREVIPNPAASEYNEAVKKCWGAAKYWGLSLFSKFLLLKVPQVIIFCHFRVPPKFFFAFKGAVNLKRCVRENKMTRISTIAERRKLLAQSHWGTVRCRSPHKHFDLPEWVARARVRVPCRQAEPAVHRRRYAKNTFEVNSIYECFCQLKPLKK